MKLLSIEITTGIDEYPDLSYLGEFTDNPSEEYTGEDGQLHWRNNLEREPRYKYPPAFRYFCPADPEYGEQSLARMEAYGLEWQMLYILIEAEVEVRGVSQTITSSGLHGIESDSGRDYIQEIIDEEVESLRAILVEMCVIDNDTELADFKEMVRDAKNESEHYPHFLYALTSK